MVRGGFAQVLAVLIFGFLVSTAVNSQTTASANPPVHQVLKDFSNQIYVMAERNGGSPEQWDSAEASAIGLLKEIASTDETQLIELDVKGRTPLIAASASGHLFFVSELLKSDIVRSKLNNKDEAGLTAYGHSLLSRNQTLLGCHPDAENPFLLIPFYVKQPYFNNRRPYGPMANVLQQAGADTDQTDARNKWLEFCSNKDESDRALLAGGTDLQLAVFEISKRVAVRKELAKLDEVIALFADMREKGSISQKVYDKAYADYQKKRAEVLKE
ncbi:MAG: hypothetical protein GY947_01550 [Rhodobacteraceae bacterium]|nr:hypothetical protein [Paracoccaceae bacterium]